MSNDGEAGILCREITALTVAYCSVERTRDICNEMHKTLSSLLTVCENSFRG